MTRPKQLSATFVKAIRRPGRYGDGRGGYGLSMLVKPTSTGRISKTWAQRLYINGQAVNLGLGAYPVVTLGEARAKALENRRAVARGMDPRSRGVPTFVSASEMVIAMHRANWKEGGDTEKQWRSSRSVTDLEREAGDGDPCAESHLGGDEVGGGERISRGKSRRRHHRRGAAQEWRSNNPPSRAAPRQGRLGVGRGAREHGTARDEARVRVSRSDRVQIGRGPGGEVD